MDKGRNKSGMTRRDFLTCTAAAGLAAGLPQLLAACSGGSDDERGDQSVVEERTLFFNFSHENFAATEHFLHAGGKKYALTQVSHNPTVLATARQSNAFLRGVPDHRITHHLERVALPANSVTLAYISSMEDSATGTWAMSMMHFILPHAAHAHAHARALAAGARLPHSAKRRAHGLPAAGSERDLIEEAMLVDSNDHALALIGLYPDLLSLEPASAAHVHASYISPDSNTEFLALVLSRLGPATVRQSAAQLNTAGWATMVPMMDTSKNPPVPLKMSDGKRNLYYPDWNPEVDQAVVPAIVSVSALVKNDETLGADVTGIAAATALSPGLAQGKLWGRHDGIASVAQTASAMQTAAPAWTFTNKSPEAGLVVTQPQVIVQGDGRVEVTMDNVSNWFLRWLGMWVRFLDPNGNIIAASALPEDTLENHAGPHPKGLDKADTLFAGVVAPAMTLFGIPIQPGKFSPIIRIPAEAQTMQVFYGGMGESGSVPENQAGLTGVGAGMTLAVNYGVVTLFMAAGVSTLDEVLKVVVTLVGEGFVEAIIDIIGSAILDGESLPIAEIAVSVMKTLVTGAVVEPALIKLGLFIASQIVTAEAVDSLPVAGQIARAVAAVIGGAELLETSLELSVSPPVYAFDLVLTHNLSVTIRPDPQAATFPQMPAGYTAYYKVSYLFDNGTAHEQSAVDLPNPPPATIAISFAGIPRGGRVNIIFGIYARNSSTPPGQNDWCAAKGATGLIDNTVDHAPDLVVTNIKIPIQASTRYIHTSKTRLDANARHLWEEDPDGSHGPAYAPPPGGQAPSLGDFRGITVRQETSNPVRAGYVGYAWKALSSNVVDCNAGSAGQLDQLANLNTDRGNGGANAQNGYANLPCGLQGGAVGSSLAYSLLSDDAANFYLDSATLFVRPVLLGNPPGFSSPVSKLAVGKLNLDSTRLLLHPAGHLVSINNAVHKLETLKLPRAAMEEARAGKSFLARTHSGAGSRPGLMTSPAAAAISPDGVILVLEDSGGNNRIQAFDLGGNPVPWFKQQKQPYFLQLGATRDAIYLDLAVEFTGYLYVLSKDSANIHRLDIYHPSQAGTAPISTTMNVNAARLTVDFWRNVYTLNYEVLRLPGGALPALTEPSVSLWVPPPPQT